MTVTDATSLEEAAGRLAGNWRQFDSFAWHRRSTLADPDAWAVVYPGHRNSGLLARSNASVVAKTLEPFAAGADPDVVAETHDHWAAGRLDGFSLRVFRGGGITPAFRAYHELAERLAEYPVLDEGDYGRREYAATLENIADAAWRLRDRYALPGGWAGAVYSWLRDHNPGAVENRDDAGGHPAEDDLLGAFAALGFQTRSTEP
ncbi:MAG: hypothetical protein K2X87_03580 [Gemmataceae bacterium]|nr:hypothetical protein [Gemmataceae bacterium]